MRLMIEKDGELFEVTEEIEGFNLDKMIAASTVIDDIARTLKFIKEADPTMGDEQIA